MDYLHYLETAWHYFPYIFYSFVFLTLLPKSLGKIKSFAAADYEANRKKYHRCYAPDNCCHTLAGQALPKPKQRKAVTRVYPKRQASTEQEAPIRRPVATSILSANHVNDIAKMFESGSMLQSRKINRVPPTVLPEIRMSSMEQDKEIANKLNKIFAAAQEQHLENNENSANYLNQATAPALDENWRSEPIAMPRQQQRPTTLCFSDGASGTPSSGSPTASSDSPAPSLDFSPIALRRMPLTLKSSLEDIFAAIARNAENSSATGDCYLKFAGCNSLSPVTSIDDILSQRRLSRPLSAYSISDLLNEEATLSAQNQEGLDEAFVENFLRTLNKT